MEKQKYISTWRNKWITAGADSIDDFIKAFESLVIKFKKLEKCSFMENRKKIYKTNTR